MNLQNRLEELDSLVETEEVERMTEKLSVPKMTVRELETFYLEELDSRDGFDAMRRYSSSIRRSLFHNRNRDYDEVLHRICDIREETEDDDFI